MRNSIHLIMSSIHYSEKIRVKVRADWEILRLLVKCFVGNHCWDYDLQFVLFIFFLVGFNYFNFFLHIELAFLFHIGLIHKAFGLFKNLVWNIDLFDFLRLDLATFRGLLTHQFDEDSINKVFFILFAGSFSLFVQKQGKTIFDCILCPPFDFFCNLGPLFHTIQL